MRPGPHKILVEIHAGRHLTEDLGVDGKTDMMCLCGLDDAHWRALVAHTAISFGSLRRISGPAQQLPAFQEGICPMKLYVVESTYLSYYLSKEQKRAGWRSGNFIDSYSGDTRFESLPGHRIS
jgi:hypothetical protein